MINTSDGTVAQRIDYDEFGRVLVQTSPSLSADECKRLHPFGFAGGLYDPDTEFVRFGARDYDPTTGRWTARDPIGFFGGDANLYGYALNEPTNLIDPLGLECDGFAARFRRNLRLTNSFFFRGPTKLSRTALGALTSGAVARNTGLTNLGMAGRALAVGEGVANLGIPGTLASLAANSVANGTLVAASLEGGIIVGSAISAGIDVFLGF